MNTINRSGKNYEIYARYKYMYICDIKHKPEYVFVRLQEHDPSEICISSITYAELVYGVEKSKAVEKNRLALALLLANIEILDFNTTAAESYGKIRADLEKSGTPIGPLDMMIAGHALSLHYTVVTNNTKEFERLTLHTTKVVGFLLPATT